MECVWVAVTLGLIGGAVAVVVFAVSAFVRVRAAERRLAALEERFAAAGQGAFAAPAPAPAPEATPRPAADRPPRRWSP